MGCIKGCIAKSKSHIQKLQKLQKCKNPFFQNYFTFSKNGHKKVCPFFKSPKKFAKKKFFFIITNEKSFFRKWERFLSKSLFCTFLHFSRKSAFFGSVLKNAAFFRTLGIAHTRLCIMLTDPRRNRHFLRPYFWILKKHRTQKTPYHHWSYFLIKNRDY